MEALLLAVAFIFAYAIEKYEHWRERQEWEEQRQFLLDRIQAPHTVQARRSEAIEPAEVSYVGTESDDDGLTGAGRSDASDET